MIKQFISLFIVLMCINYSNSQSISISAGVVINQYHNFNIELDDQNDYSTKEFQIGGSQFLKINFSSIGGHPLFNSMSMTINKSSGKLLLGSTFYSMA